MAPKDKAPEGVDQDTSAADPVDIDAIAVSDLVELHDGAYAIVLTVDPVTVLRLGVPQLHELPVRKVG